MVWCWDIIMCQEIWVCYKVYRRHANIYHHTHHSQQPPQLSSKGVFTRLLKSTHSSSFHCEAYKLAYFTFDMIHKKISLISGGKKKKFRTYFPFFLFKCDCCQKEYRVTMPCSVLVAFKGIARRAWGRPLAARGWWAQTS